MITIERYRPSDEREWNDFVRASRNATFLHERRFMDYHSDRFTDCSLIFRRNGRLTALLPAELSSDNGISVLHSHRGLTYGGLLLPPRHCSAGDVMDIFDELKAYCTACDISALDYKPVPAIYHRAPSQEDIYALWRHGAVMSGCNLSVAIDLSHNPGYDTRQKRNCKRATATSAEIVRIGTDTEIERFHAMLGACLSERHEAHPVHYVDELKLLHARFPEEIQFYVAIMEGEMQAGVCLFDCGMAVHTQYICSTAVGRENGLLSLLMQSVVSRSESLGARYLDFGTCNEDGGRYLNLGLAAQKYGFGGTGVSYERYRLNFRDDELELR